jgi:hypothetical protein
MVSLSHDVHLPAKNRVYLGMLTSDVEMRAKLDHNFLAFGASPRTFIGKNISMLEMSKVVP